MEKLFTIRGVFKEARAIVKPRLWTVVGQYAALLVGFMLLSILAGNNLLLSILLSALYAFIISAFSLGYAKGEFFSFGEFLKSVTFQKFAYFFLAYVVSKLIVMGGFILLVIPGIMLSVWLCFVNFIMTEKEMGPWDASKESMRISSGYRWKLFGFFLVAFFFNLLGLICLFVGLFYTMPVTMIAFGLIYKKLYEGKDFVPEIVEVIEEIDIIEVVPEETVEA